VKPVAVDSALAEQITTNGAVRNYAGAPSGQQGWPPLPRRAAPGRTSSLFAIRTPISPAARWTLTTLSLAIPLLAWVVLSASKVVSPVFLPSPGAVLSAGWDMVRSGELFGDLWATAQRVLYGFGLAVLVSVPLGIMMGSFHAGRAVFEPVIGLLRYLPASAFIPLFIIWLGIGETAKISIIALVMFAPLVISAQAGVRSVSIGRVQAALSLGASRRQLFFHVVLPGAFALPEILTGVRIAIGAGWSTLVAAELVAATRGLGFMTLSASEFLVTDVVFVGILTIAAFAIAFVLAVRSLERVLTPWKGKE
jgi:NitT/TauT family transport system permease protein